MTLKNNTKELKRCIENSFPMLNPENTQKFIDDLTDGINTGWAFDEALSDDISGEEDFEDFLLNIKKEGEALDNEFFKVAKEIKQETERFREIYHSYLELISIMHYPIPSTHKLEDELEILLCHMDTALKNFTNEKRGRTKRNYKRIFVRKIFVMGDCLLDIKGSTTNNETPFNNLLRLCFDFAGINTHECEYHIRPCFNDYLTICSMRQDYKKYNSDDLFLAHIKRTEWFDEIYDEFFAHY